MKALATASLAALALAACTSAPPKSPPPPAASRDAAPARASAPVAQAPRRSPYAPAQEDPSKRGDYTPGGLYAPGVRDTAPDGLADVDLIPEPDITAEPHSRYGNRSPYVVLGKSYRVLDSAAGYEETGTASFYGNKFHGRRTSNLEVYDMYAFTAAHKTLPLPSFARVTNLANGRSVVVRVNDRGPFHDGRIIDLSYAAAVKLGIDRAGTGRVQVQGLAPGEGLRETRLPDTAVAQAAPSAIDRLVAALPEAPVAAPAAPTAAPTTTTEWRFDMRQDGRTMTADEFDAWMRARQARVATGRPQRAPPPGTAPAVPSTLATATLASPPEPLPPAAGNAPALPPVAAEVAPAPAPTGALAPTGGAVVLQVASFAERTNAEHALALLSGAGIAGARLLDADANGRRVWRLRVGPVAAEAAPDLVARITGLGFGQPQRVRE